MTRETKTLADKIENALKKWKNKKAIMTICRDGKLSVVNGAGHFLMNSEKVAPSLDVLRAVGAELHARGFSVTIRQEVEPTARQRRNRINRAFGL